MRKIGFLIATFLFVALPAPGVEPDPIKDKLDKAKAVYAETLEKAKKEILDELQKKEDLARQEGDKSAVDLIKADRKAFVSSGELPKSISPIAYNRTVVQARGSIDGEYTSAIKEYTKVKRDDDANKVEAEWKEMKKAQPASVAADKNPKLVVQDAAGFFSAGAIEKAQGLFADIKDNDNRILTFVTVKELSEAKFKDYDKLKDNSSKERFFTELATEEARAIKAKGVFVFICRKPTRLMVLAGKEFRGKGFTSADEQRIEKLLLDKFRESNKADKEEERLAIRDKALLNAAEFVRDAYKKMVR